MLVSLIVAISDNNVIGYKNQLPWHIPQDLARFKTLTQGHHIIMGRNTFRSIGRALPHRTSVIISQTIKSLDSCIVVPSLKDALGQCSQDDNPFIIGGEQVFRDAFMQDVVDRIYLTRVNRVCRGDIFFPNVSLDNYELSKCENFQEFSFKQYIRKI